MERVFIIIKIPEPIQYYEDYSSGSFSYSGSDSGSFDYGSSYESSSEHAEVTNID